VTNVIDPPVTFVPPFSTPEPFAKFKPKPSLKVSRFQDTQKTVVKSMTYVPNHVGMVNLEDSSRILRVIFPNYPELKPCNPGPTLEPIAPSIVENRVGGAAA